MADVSNTNADPEDQQRKLSSMLQLIHRFVVIEVPKKPNKSKELRALLRDLDTIATCLATGRSGDVVAVGLSDRRVQDAVNELVVSRNAAPTYENIKAAEEFFEAIQASKRIDVLKTIHAASALNMEKRRDKLRQRSQVVLRFKSQPIPPHIFEQLQKIHTASTKFSLLRGQNEAQHSTTSKVEQFHKLIVQCTEFLNNDYRHNLEAMAKEKGKRPIHFTRAVKAFGRALNKICQYKIGIDKLIKAKKRWNHRWVKHEETSRYAEEFPKLDGDEGGLQIPDYLTAWTRLGIRRPTVSKFIGEMDEMQLLHLWRRSPGGQASQVPHKTVVLEALEAQFKGKLVEVPIDNEELKARLTEHSGDGSGKAIIDVTDPKDNGWATKVHPVVHAEIRIILDRDGQQPARHKEPQPIGVSKRSCGSCILWMLGYNEEFGAKWLTSDTHGKFYWNFALAGLVIPLDTLEEYKMKLTKIVTRFLRDVRVRLDRYVGGFQKGRYQQSDEAVSPYTTDEFGTSSEPGY